MTLFYLDTADAHSLRSRETLGNFFGVAFLTHEAAADAQVSLDDCDDLEIVEADARDLPDDVKIPTAGFAIVAGDEGPVYGVGATISDAETAASQSYDQTRESPEVVEWALRDAADSGLVYSIPCTQDLIDAVADRGGMISFDIIGRGKRAVAVLA